MSKLLVTGSQGMVGRHLVSLLQQCGEDVLPFSRKDWELSFWLSLDELDILLADVSVVFHVAAIAPNGNQTAPNTSDLFDVNVRTVLNLSEWCYKRQVPFIFISGSTVYEDCHAASIREDAPKVKSGLGGFYGYTKYLAENVIEHFVEQGLKAIVLRPSSIYGFGMAKSTIVSRFLEQANSGESLSVSGAANSINFIHASDVAKAAMSAYVAKSWGVFNIAAEHSCTILELAEAIVDVVGSGSIDVTPDTDGIPFKRFDLSCLKAKNAFSYQSLAPLREGIKLMNVERTLNAK